MTKESIKLPKKLHELLKKFDQKSIDLIEASYRFACTKHFGQKRKSGKPYLVHPLAIAINLAKDGYDPITISAGLLHDTLEDTDTSLMELKEKFGDEITNIVDGVTKVSAIKIKDKQDLFSEKDFFNDKIDNYRKILLATANDPRVLVVKVYDRFDNIQTIKWIKPEKQKFYARETISIFAPLAERLGMGQIKGQLEDLAFPHAFPDEYKNFQKEIRGIYSQPEKVIEKTIPEIKRLLGEQHIQYVSLDARAKFKYSLYKKILRKGSAKSIFDIIALRIIVKNLEDCYKILGALHTKYDPLPGKIKDYIAKPKLNGYQSLHTTLKNENGDIFEVQIRTDKMHHFAEYGLAAHWSFKDIGPSQRKALKEWQEELRKLEEIGNKKELAGEFKDQFFTEQIFVFTPKGDIIRLPKGSTPLDFAYRIHTNLGEKCAGARVNSRITPLNFKLNTGDVVDIIKSNQVKPTRDWLKLVKTSHAKRKIKTFLKKENEDFFAELGEKKILEFLNRYLIEPLQKNLIDKKIQNSRIPYNSYYKALTAIGENKLRISDLIKVLYPNFSVPQNPEKQRLSLDKNDNVILKGIRHETAQCCKPSLSDQSIGYLNKEHIIKVHRADCRHIRTADKRRLINL